MDFLSKTPAEISAIITRKNNFAEKAAFIDKIIEKFFKKYYNFKDIFDRAAATKLPPYRDYNYKIKLTSESIPLRSRIYPLFNYKF